MDKLPIPLDVLVEFCWHIRCQRPDKDKCAWPAIRSDKTQQIWNEIATNYGWALDPHLPWMEEYEDYKTLLGVALKTHNWGPDAEEFPNAIFINKAARILHKNRQEHKEMDRKVRERQMEDDQRPEDRDTYWRCTRLMAYRGIIPLTKNNPYADRMEEVLEWARQQDLETEPVPQSSFLRGGVINPKEPSK